MNGALWVWMLEKAWINRYKGSPKGRV